MPVACRIISHGGGFPGVLEGAEPLVSKEAGNGLGVSVGKSPGVG